MIYIILLALGIIYLKFFKGKNIKYKTFKYETVPRNDKYFGVYCYCGEQGNFKTYSVVKYLYQNRDKKIFCNMSSIDKNEIEYEYFCGLRELLALADRNDLDNSVIFYDEIFTDINKNNKMGDEVFAFLSQMRKRNIVFITTCQYWLLLPPDFRKYVRFQIDVSYKKILKWTVISKIMYDGQKLKWDDTIKDFVGPMIDATYENACLVIANMYDTHEVISSKRKSKTLVFEEKK